MSQRSSHAQPEAYYVARTFQILELLAFQPLSAPQVAATLQVHPRTARRTLVRLHQEGYLTRTDDTRRVYTPSMRLIALAGQAARAMPLVQEADRAVASLHDTTGVGAFAASPSYADVIVLASAGSDAPGLLSLLPAATSAAGRVLLAHRQAWRDSRRGDTGLGEEAAAAIRQRRHADSEDGSSLAVPVWTDDPPIAALALIGPADRLGAERERLVTLLHDAADGLDGNLT